MFTVGFWTVVKGRATVELNRKELDRSLFVDPTSTRAPILDE